MCKGYVQRQCLRAWNRKAARGLFGAGWNEGFATVFAIACVFVVVAKATAFANAGGELSSAAGQFVRDDAGRDGDDAVTNHHEDAGDNAARDGVRRDVTVADSRDGDHGPIHGGGNAGEAVFRAFDLIHERADEDDNGKDSENKHGDLAETGEHGGTQSGGFADKLRELENAEDAEKAEGAKKTKRAGDAGEKAEVDGTNGEKIDEAEETVSVAAGVGRGDQTSDVFDGEESGEGPFGNAQERAMFLVNAADALQENGEDTEKNKHQEDEVKEAASMGVMTEDDFVPLVAPGCARGAAGIRMVHGRGPFRAACSGQDTAFERDALGLARLTEWFAERVFMAFPRYDGGTLLWYIRGPHPRLAAAPVCRQTTFASRIERNST